MVICSMRMTDEQFKKELFDRSQRYEVKKKKRRKAILTICIPLFCAGVITAVFAGLYINDEISEYKLFPDKNNTFTDNYDGAGAMLNGENAESAEIADNTAVYYSELDLPEGTLNQDMPDISYSDPSDIVKFSESVLLQEKCCMIIEGTVTNQYVKHYYYDVSENESVLHNVTDTVVYEIKVDKVWYGDDISGETIIVEDMFFYSDPVLMIKEGKRYVLPLYDAGESILLNDDFAEDDIKRESGLSIIYPYHPQIEITNDGEYLISDDWKTLTEKNSKKVIMDTLDDNNYYYDKMCLIDEDSFAQQISILISELE